MDDSQEGLDWTRFTVYADKQIRTALRERGAGLENASETAEELREKGHLFIGNYVREMDKSALNDVGVANDLAIFMLQVAHCLVPQDSYVVVSLANKLYQTGGESAAIETMSRYIADNPGNVYVLGELVKTLLNAGDFKGAHVFATRSHDTIGSTMNAIALNGMGRFDEARQILEKIGDAIALTTLVKLFLAQYLIKSAGQANPDYSYLTMGLNTLDKIFDRVNPSERDARLLWLKVICNGLLGQHDECRSDLLKLIVHDPSAYHLAAFFALPHYDSDDRALLENVKASILKKHGAQGEEFLKNVERLSERFSWRAAAATDLGFMVPRNIV